MSNHFRLIPRSGLVLWHYNIIVHPEIKGPRLTQIIKVAFNSGDYKNLKPDIVTDFSAIMLSVREAPVEYRTFKLLYHSELETQASENANEYWISLAPIGTIDLSDPQTYLGPTEKSSNSLPIEQALDIILGHHRKLSDDIAIVNKRKAFSINPQRAGEYDSFDLRIPALTALRGYFSSVRMSKSSILVNINVSHGAFYKAFLGLRVVIGWLENHSGVARSKIPGLLRGLRVKSLHIPRVWSIWGYPRDGDGKGYMLHPPRFNPPNATSYTPEQVRFFYDEKPKGDSTDQAQALSEEDKADAKEGRLRAHDERCTCSGRWLTVADYFKTGTVTS